MPAKKTHCSKCLRKIRRVGQPYGVYGRWDNHGQECGAVEALLTPPDITADEAKRLRKERREAGRAQGGDDG